MPLFSLKKLYKHGSDTSTSHPQPRLNEQHLVPAPPATKIRLSMLATAMVDALGGPTEFQARFSFPLTITMIPNDNFDLPAGVWTDDTSMALCLAQSLATYIPPKGSSTGDGTLGFDQAHQMRAYCRWHQYGELSAIGSCFDIGNTINRAVSIFTASDNPNAGLKKIEKQLGGENYGGNGSLMRVLPVGLAYWRRPHDAARLARLSSATTHPNEVCKEACELWTRLIVRIMESCESGGLTKMDLLDQIVYFPFATKALKDVLGVVHDAPQVSNDGAGREDYYRRYHPILALVAQMEAEPPIDKDKLPYHIPDEEQLSSSGYVVDSLVAALYCFFATTTFEYGAIMAANLGGDADTVGAIYAGLAACWYAEEKRIPAQGKFWSDRVEKWKRALVKRELVEGVAEQLVELSVRVGEVENGQKDA
ncbi:ADP-ribosylation/Crystallin J1 [Cyathus striatus]|nr:ADP-ribosylation/Crystallin J1 [Cyathus striatus]